MRVRQISNLTRALTGFLGGTNGAAGHSAFSRMSYSDDDDEEFILEQYRRFLPEYAAFLRQR